MSKHTPAPWEWEVRYNASVDSIRHWALIGANGRPIIICDKGTPNDFGDGENADARLIASAPELLEALEVIAETPAGSMANDSEALRHMHNFMVGVARQAIAKAEGAEFYCSEWSRVGYICDEGQCEKCAKAEGNP